MTRPSWPIREVRRWTDAELDELQHQLNAESRINPLCRAASNAIGSLRFDKVDLRVELDKAARRSE